MKEIQELGRIDPKSGYLVESCCIFFIVVLRWFNSTLKSQEPLKINSDRFHPSELSLGWMVFIRDEIKLTSSFCCRNLH